MVIIIFLGNIWVKLTFLRAHSNDIPHKKIGVLRN